MKDIFEKAFQPSKLIIINAENFNISELTCLATLQGLLARNSDIQLYIIDKTIGDYEFHLEILIKKYNIKILDEYANCIAKDILALFLKYIKCYICYEEIKYTLNNANSLSGLFDGIVVEKNMVEIIEFLESNNIKQGPIVESHSPLWLIDNYIDILKQEIIVEQRMVDKLNVCLRDYITFSKCICFILNPYSYDRAVVLKKLKKCKYIIGWGDAVNMGCETPFIIESSLCGLQYIPLDNALNLTVLSSFNSANDKYIQKTKNEIDLNMTNKHFVLFVISDGDNLQWFINRGNDKKWWGSESRGDIPICWTIPPSSTILCPSILDYHYDTMTENDGFIIGPSGGGFCFPSLLPSEKQNNLINDIEFKTLDIDSVMVLDLNNFKDSEIWDVYKDNIILHFDWWDFKLNRQMGIKKNNKNGFIVDCNCKLFEPEKSDDVINFLNKKDHETHLYDHSGNIYSIVYVNNWSGEDRVKEIKDIVGKLNSNVIPVTTKQFNSLIRNVKIDK